MIEILVAIVIGFCAGIVGALVTHEALLQKFEEKYTAERQFHEELSKTIDALREHDHMADIAMQTMIIKFQKERGALWESLNGLWNDYDKRHKEDTQETANETVSEEKENAEH